MRGFVMVGAVVAVGLGMWGCGGSYSRGNSGNPNSPTPPSAAGVVTVNVVAINGAQSFSPNPATLPASQMPMPVEAGSGPYHCTIHPVMVGSINQGTASQQPCTGAYCD